MPFSTMVDTAACCLSSCPLEKAELSIDRQFPMHPLCRCGNKVSLVEPGIPHCWFLLRYLRLLFTIGIEQILSPEACVRGKAFLLRDAAPGRLLHTAGMSGQQLKIA